MPLSNMAQILRTQPHFVLVLQLRQRMEIQAPSEESIALLMGLGFDRDTVIRVLRASGNNPEAAANRLLGH